MRIKKIRLKHFKRFDDLTIQLGDRPKKVIALVGPNGCGKSSIFDSFEEILKNYKSAQRTPDTSFLSKLYFSIIPGRKTEAYNKSDAIQIIKADDSSTFDRKSFYIRSPYRFTSRLNVTSIKSLSDMVADGMRPSSSIDIDSRLQENYERLLGKAFEEYQHGTKSGPEMREELVGKINDILANILDIKISDLGNVTANKGQLYFDKESSKNFPYENLSSGEKEVIDIIIDLVVKSSEFDDTVYCIDEPELHLHTAIQRKLLIEIDKLIPDNCQLWLATHSIGFLRALQDELKDKCSILDFSEKDYFNSSIIMEPIAITRINWQRIFKTALEDLTGLIAPRQIIYCEGKKEPDASGNEQGLDAEVLNAIFEKEFHDTLFVSSGGSTEPDKYSGIALSILCKVFDNVELLLLKDKDINSDGTPTTVAQREAFIKADPKRNRMLERKELENYLFDFEIVSKQFPSLPIDEYNKLITNVRDEDVKQKAGALMHLCDIKTGLNKQKFKRLLSEQITANTKVYEKLKSCIFQK